jgi:hypothetical protein
LVNYDSYLGKRGNLKKGRKKKKKEQVGGGEYGIHSSGFGFCVLNHI